MTRYSLAPWTTRALVRALEAQLAGRLPHALLVHGPESLGKRALAEALARSLLCRAPTPAGGCGECVSCRQFDTRFQRDPPEQRPDGSPAHPEGHPMHPDARFVGFVLNEKSSPKRMYQDIVIEQMRELGAWLVLSPQHGSTKVALIEPAHALTTAAANALLKTLEEPVPGRHIILVSDRAHRLPATIRSRCQRLEVKLPDRAECLAWLESAGVTGAQAEAALDARLGHPGLALRDVQQDATRLRDQVARDLAALAQGRERAASVAPRWLENETALRLQFAVEAILEHARAQARGRPATSALARAGLAPGAGLRELAPWVDQANRVRDQLRLPLRQDLMLAELLQAWRRVCLQGATIAAG